VTTKGILYRPEKSQLSGKSIKGVVIYFHPTIFGRVNGPSNNNDYWKALGSLYASQNYVLVAIDYLGYNSNYI